MRVSVIIPCHNAAPFLASAITSALSQTVMPDEIIVVDDASRDGSERIARGFPGVRVLVLPRNVGASAARNIAVQEARGDWLAFLDADDEWEPGKLELQLPYTADDSVGVVYGQFRRLPADGILSRVVPDELPVGHVMTRLYFTSFVLQSTALVRRLAFTQVGGYDEAVHLVEDFDLWLRLSEHWHFAAPRGPLIRYRIHGAQATARFGEQMAAFLRTQLRFGPMVDLKSELSRAERLERLAAFHERHVRRLFRRRQFFQGRVLADAIIQELGSSHSVSIHSVQRLRRLLSLPEALFKTADRILPHGTNS